MPIQPGQTYRSADPRGGPRIRIERYTLGHNHAWVVDAQDSKRARWVLARSLHTTATTKNGTPRRTGYVLEQPATVRDAARQATGQTTGVPCGVCGTPWTDTHGYSGDCQTTGQTAARPDPAIVEQFIRDMASLPDPTTADDPTPCTCDSAGPEFVPAGHYKDCPQYDAPAPAVGQPAATPNTNARQRAYDNLYAELTRGVSHAQVRHHLIEEHRAAVLREAADEAERENAHCPPLTVSPCQPCAVRTAIAAHLRRTADEETQR